MNFISEKDVEEAKKKREEEWKKAREEGREIPEEEPEEFRDTRPLYEKLQEQRDKKQDAFEEQLKFKNMIYKGLDEGDAQFLSDVAQKQAEMDGKRFELESEEIAEFRAATEVMQSKGVAPENKPSEEKKEDPAPKISSSFIVKKKTSQASILASAIVRKRKPVADPPTCGNNEKEDQVPEKQSRLSTNGIDGNDVALSETLTGKKISSNEVEDKGDATEVAPTSLSLLAGYPSSSEDETDD